MKVDKGIEMLEISANVMGKPGIIYPTLIWSNDEVVLIDAGFPDQIALFRDAFKKAGVPFNKLKIIILTHQDIDHIGSLLSIQTELPNVKVLAHEEEKAYIQGDKSPIKVAQLEARLNSLSPEGKAIYEKLKAGFQNCKAKIDKTLMGQEELPYCGGITVIYTPGHTPGHICLYHKQSKTLISGDLLSIEEGRLIKTPSFVDFDNDLAKNSLKKLIQYDIEKVICYHGGLFKDKTNTRIAELTGNK
ncbi:beta-lactamase domain protein [Desulfofarcimen acetoxidans DSM 771]|jgi:glyoxylase-like metal-dependent hydrolase (beta-lactamase superfamily II)|uniref:Beta-lactamase domain protein n=1 Tax=Desulfofarcimen acetoxidans (strain ATCC 49208 / DSM 771 / KCTC 5769 / VKM B-1644 / 5575) TaxID=485916 RepID=C8VZ79_DESAS|nr:MBL fold metallo-hydrolase [Desulfofarcimen acetoxidans]ACV62989.1 beta-lactamase domain protein [Desulfofarcimen acetoxidans DSM 771]